MNGEPHYRTHDHIDRDVVSISKNKLIRELGSAVESATVTRAIAPYGGFALTLLSAAFLTDTFHNFYVISGETIRAVFLLGGLVMSFLTVMKAARWRQLQGEHSPEAIVERLAPTATEARPNMLLLPSSVSDNTDGAKRSSGLRRKSAGKLSVQPK